ncbi:MAG: DUF87 domain-containing protein [Candidatus Thermoplasmatota archaeon]
MALRRQVGIIYGAVSSTGFDVAVGDAQLKRLDYVEVEAEGQRVLGQVERVVRRSSLSYEQAIAIPDGFANEATEQLTATIRVIGYRDGQGRVQVPRTPLRAGVSVILADDGLITSLLGLEQDADAGAYLGFVKGSRVPVALDMDMLAQKHLSVLAKTGAGKSYTVGVILEEFLKANVPLVILDPHGEYGSLRSANLDEAEIQSMVRYRIKPRSFHKQIREYALDTGLNPEAQKLTLAGMNLEGREIVEMLGNKLSGSQVGVLYQAIQDVKQALPAYTLKDIQDSVSRNKSNGKWNVLNALELLDSTKLFDLRGTPVRELVAPGQCSIINLKGVGPDIQEIVVTRLASMLWEARKRGEVPAHILVVEEAHNFCPERNVGNAVSGAIIRTVASEGRKFGLGLVIVSQRPAKIDKNVLSQCNTQVVLKVTNPNDLKAIVQSVEGISNEVADEIQRLAVGEALVAGGGLTQPVFVAVRPRMTAHGGKSVSVLHLEEEDEEPETPAIPSRPASPPAPLPPQVAPPPPTAPPQPPSPEPRAKPSPPPLPVAEAEAEISAYEPWTAIPMPELEPEPRPTPAPAARPRRLAKVDADELTSKPRAAWSATDARAIHRVAARVGWIGATTGPAEAVRILADLEESQHRDPDARLRLLREIADNACHEAAPACVRCPLSGSCLHQRALKQQRQTGGAPVRRLWQR